MTTRNTLWLALSLAACTGNTVPEDTDRTAEPAECPHLGAVEATLDFGAVAIGGDNVLPVLVANDCEGQIALGVTARVDGDEAFTLDEDAVGVAAGAAGEIVVRFSPVDYAAHEATLVLETTDPENPTATVTLRGQAVPDQDGDGHEATEAGGDDCDDSDPSAFPGSTEVEDLADDDCDGAVDEGFVDPGAILVTEMMIRPTAAADAVGEWIELYNASEAPVELRGWHVGVSASSGFAIEESLVLEPGSFAVIGASTDPAENGSVAVDAAWPSGEFSLPDDSGAVVLALAGEEMFRLDYDTSWKGVDGASLSLDSESVSPATAPVKSYWCNAQSELASGDKATPGATNDWCPSVDHDRDGASEIGGDCDDTDPTVGPDAAELYDGLDQDCDGEIDDLSIGSATATLAGGTGEYLGYSSMGLGDVDGDGQTELLVGSRYAGSSHGQAYVFEGADWASFSGNASSYDESEFSPTYAWYFGSVPLLARDHTGDGEPDLLVGGGEYAGTDYAWVVFESAISGSLDVSDATMYGTNYSSTSQTVIAAPDMNGDGVAEIAYGASNTGSGSTLGLVTVHDPDGLTGAVDYADAALALTGTTVGDYLGSSLASADLDDDGYDDIIAGAYGYHDGEPLGGGLFVVGGGSSYPASGTVDGVASLTLRGNTRSQYLGMEKGIAVGDLDGNGSLDLAGAAAYGSDVYVLFDAGSRSGTVDDTDADATISGTSLYFGWAVQAEDLDDDGADELLVGNYGGGAASSGIWIFGGLSAGAWDQDDASASITGTSTGEQLWSWLAGDLDGDGTAEAVVATSTSSPSAGKLYFLDL
jgi:hypothetical protein